MGRKKSFTETELLAATEKLVLEHGYEGFTLKMLSQHLPGARSTIYQYYPSKEAIVAACMKRAIQRVLSQASAVDETDPMDALKQLLLIYLAESELHRLLGDAGKIQATYAPEVVRNLAEIEQAHQELQAQLGRLFQRAVSEESLRADLPLPVLIGLFLNLFSTPNLMGLPKPAWGELLFDLWLHGARR